MSKLFEVLKRVPYFCVIDIVVTFDNGSEVKSGFKTNSTAARVKSKILAGIELDMGDCPELAGGSMAAFLAIFENANFTYRREWRAGYYIELNKEVSGIAGVKSIRIKIKPTIINRLFRRERFDEEFFKI
ncbi:hypothetical protein HYT55_02835 [Candidatus Woesearchaeota archaeon]|nr:hypothetical protein [Candidatus Woesearchaeota archaeon]